VRCSETRAPRCTGHTCDAHNTKTIARRHGAQTGTATTRVDAALHTSARTRADTAPCTILFYAHARCARSEASHAPPATVSELAVPQYCLPTERLSAHHTHSPPPLPRHTDCLLIATSPHAAR
jgi:hypothetical protein